MNPIIRRAIWNGTPVEEAIWWTLRKGGRESVCRMFSHELGHELRLEVAGEVVATQVCRSDAEILTCQEQWRAGLEAKAWHR